VETEKNKLARLILNMTGVSEVIYNIALNCEDHSSDRNERNPIHPTRIENK